MFCRHYHQRTYNLIEFCREFLPDDDKELIDFFDECHAEDDDPRTNSVFRKKCWPDLGVVTKCDLDKKVINTLSEFKKDLPIILKYTSIY